MHNNYIIVLFPLFLLVLGVIFLPRYCSKFLFGVDSISTQWMQSIFQRVLLLLHNGNRMKYTLPLLCCDMIFSIGDRQLRFLRHIITLRKCNSGIHFSIFPSVKNKKICWCVKENWCVRLPETTNFFYMA